MKHLLLMQCDSVVSCFAGTFPSCTVRRLCHDVAQQPSAVSGSTDSSLQQHHSSGNASLMAAIDSIDLAVVLRCKVRSSCGRFRGTRELNTDLCKVRTTSTPQGEGFCTSRLKTRHQHGQDENSRISDSAESSLWLTTYQPRPQSHES